MQHLCLCNKSFLELIMSQPPTMMLCLIDLLHNQFYKLATFPLSEQVKSILNLKRNKHFLIRNVALIFLTIRITLSYSWLRRYFHFTSSRRNETAYFYGFMYYQICDHIRKYYSLQLQKNLQKEGVTTKAYHLEDENNL